MPRAIQENIVGWCRGEGKVSKPQVSGIVHNAKEARMQTLRISISNRNSTSPPVLC